MTMDWLLDGIRDRMTKLWRSEATGGLQALRLRDLVYPAPTPRRGTKGYLTVG
jgi:hypothetical protein